MNTIEAIQTRRNIKLFKADPIARETIVSWLEAASFAPNHRMTEPWEIRFVGPETRAKLNHKTDFGGAPVVVLITSKGAPTPIDREEHLMASACFAQNFLLAAHDAGAGAFWSSLAASPRSREILGVPEGDDVVGIFGVGYPAEIPQPKERTPIALKITDLA
ncbi:nitroreductase family protein [Cohnella thermotolerans]|jgi:nitroreductase|uniref:nitroreductase family protein n=1 Tax=Cohnella thermotolerans TaxID=329858 RepID=UPI0003F913DE|nr:nitroreductase family protein [Cohnella thermotolerans]